MVARIHMHVRKNETQRVLVMAYEIERLLKDKSAAKIQVSCTDFLPYHTDSHQVCCVLPEISKTHTPYVTGSIAHVARQETSSHLHQGQV